MSPTGVTAPRHRVVVGVDGSPSSIDALRLAARIASDTGAEIDAVTAWELPPSYGMMAGPADWDPATDAGQTTTAALATAFGARNPDGLRVAVYQGHAARILIDASIGADLLVVGSRGHGGFVGMLLGSVSASCAEHAHCPVLVARAPSAGPTPAAP